MRHLCQQLTPFFLVSTSFRSNFLELRELATGIRNFVDKFRYDLITSNCTFENYSVLISHRIPREIAKISRALKRVKYNFTPTRV